MYKFGRDTSLNDDEDGLHFFDNTDPASTKHVRISVGESVPSMVLQGEKSSNVPTLDIRTLRIAIMAETRRPSRATTAFS